MAGVYAGEFVMEGFLQLRLPRALRALVTRAAAIVPALAVTLVAGQKGSERLIVMCSVILSFEARFPLHPFSFFLFPSDTQHP